MNRLAKLCVTALLGALVPAAWAAQYPFQDSSLPIDQRVADLVGRLTPEEKVSQMPLTAAAVPRFGIPEYTWWNEGLHGIARSGTATVFPQAIGLAATFDPQLMHTIGDTIATEARAKYADAIAHNNHLIYFGLTIWSPNINIFRDPRWGRGQETYGEDPYLTARMGVGFVTGLQGDDPKYLKTIATPKHFVVHSGPERLRHEFDVRPSPQDLEATYLPAFRATLTEGQAASTMCAYNAVYGVPACANQPLLEKTIRGDFHFHGFVTSDCWAVTDIWKGHKYAPDEEHAAALALKAGTDTTCGPEFKSLTQALKDKLVSQAEIDTAVTRLFTARFRLGMFDPPAMVPYNSIPHSEVDSEAHRQLARRVAEESFVLLKNTNQTLPLMLKGKTLAVVGPNAAVLESLEGNYSGQPSHPVLPLDGMEKRFGAENKVVYAQGSSYVAGFPVIVPRYVLHSVGTGGNAIGLKGEYFSNSDFQGTPAVIRIDPQLDFDWGATAPAEGIPPTGFSVRWTGSIAMPGAGSYTLHVTPEHCGPCEGKDTFRLYLDDKQVITTARDEKAGNAAFTLKVADTAPHALRVEYVHTAPMFGAGIHLTWEPEAAPLREQAVALARHADVVVAFAGLSPSLEGEEMPVELKGFRGGDRTDIALPQLQIDLLRALAATGKPLVVVLMNGSALAVPQDLAAAVLEAWYPGEEGGAAVAEILAGDVNPAGRLPVTFYASIDQLPPFEDYSMKGRTYRYFTGEPQYGFGYGLSYTSFAYSHVKVSSTAVKAGDPVTVEANVSNSGQRAGDEVVQLYLRGPQSAGAPLRQLRSFERIALQPGEGKHVSFTLDPDRLSEVNEEGVRAAEPGNYTVYVGGGQPGHSAGEEASFAVTP